MSSTYRLVTTVVFTWSLAAGGCVLQAGPGGANTTAYNPNDAQMRDAQIDAGSGPALVIRNASNRTICYVQISPSSDSQWGPDRLGASETILPGRIRGWRVTPGNWDVRILDCDQNVLGEERNVRVQGQGTVLTYSG
ncbi:MAG: hypothetical protein NZ898_16095 [Myxococcota bacterium]|nr:hypothetical protein [Myxococcota bacterium]